MKVKFRRPYFSKEGVTYQPRTIVEVPDDTELPSDAEKVTDLPKDFQIPSDAVPALPGFTAKPPHHEAMAQVGAEPTHLIGEATGVSHAGITTTDEKLKKGEVAETRTQSAPLDPKATLTNDPKKVPSTKDDRSSKDPNKDL